MSADANAMTRQLILALTCVALFLAAWFALIVLHDAMPSPYRLTVKGEE